MKKFIQFIKETWYRFGLPSPTYFNVIKMAAAVVAFFTGLPALLLKYETDLNIKFPEWVFMFSSKTAAFIAVVGFLLAKLPVKDPDALKVKKDGAIVPKLSFTKSPTMVLFIGIFMSLLLMLGSCKVSYMTTRSQQAIEQVVSAQKSTDQLYDGIMASDNKNYYTYANDYATIGNQIHEILVLDSSRQKSKIILSMANDIQKRFEYYRSIHEKRLTLNNSELRSFKDYMKALYSSLANTENSFKDPVPAAAP